MPRIGCEHVQRGEQEQTRCDDRRRQTNRSITVRPPGSPTRAQHDTAQHGTHQNGIDQDFADRSQRAQRHVLQCDRRNGPRAEQVTAVIVERALGGQCTARDSVQRLAGQGTGHDQRRYAVAHPRAMRQEHRLQDQAVVELVYPAPAVTQGRGEILDQLSALVGCHDAGTLDGAIVAHGEKIERHHAAVRHDDDERAQTKAPPSLATVRLPRGCRPGSLAHA
jgi:hypothetical protein